jgi:aryl-alcohol dehydrogenase-like predicted oxidoreductase
MGNMQTRKLGWTDLELTTAGLGTWALGGGGWEFSWGPQDDRDSIWAIERALDLGINWIDTAAVYGLGHSEEIVGEALKSLKKKPIVATKCSRVWDERGHITGNLKRRSILAEAEASLRRLQVDVIDLYQIHWPIPDEDIEEAWSAMGDLIQQGKIRYAGVSNFSVAQLKRLQPIRPVASLQPPYSMLQRDVEAELLPYCAENNIGVVAYSPMQRGLLTSAFSKERLADLASDDSRRDDPQFLEPAFSATLELVEGLKKIAEKNGRPVAQLAIAWVLRRPEVTAAIVGARRPSQIEETAPAVDWVLSDEDIATIDKLLAERDRKVRGV